MADLPPVTFTHLGIWVTDLDRMSSFYQRMFNFHQSDRGMLDMGEITTELAFLTRDPKVHHQIVLLAGRPKEVPFNVLNQLSLLVGSLADLRLHHEALVAEPEVTRLHPLTHGNAWSVYFDDPEHNRVEIYADTPWYCHQPFRGPLDFSLSDEEIYSNTEELVKKAPGADSVGNWRDRVAGALGLGDWDPDT